MVRAQEVASAAGSGSATDRSPVKQARRGAAPGLASPLLQEALAVPRPLVVEKRTTMLRESAEQSICTRNTKHNDQTKSDIEPYRVFEALISALARPPDKTSEKKTRKRETKKTRAENGV